MRARGAGGSRAGRERELFVQAGMLGWLKAWTQYASAGAAARQRDNPDGVRPAVVVSGAVADVLATMTWAVVAAGG